MKKALLCASLLLVPALASARPVERGTFEISGATQMALTSHHREFGPGDEVDETTSDIQLGLGFYLAPNLALGVEWIYGSTTVEDDLFGDYEETNSMVGPYLEADFTLSPELNLFLLGRAGVISSEIDDESYDPPYHEDSSGWYYGGAVGLKFFVIPAVSLNVSGSITQGELEDGETLDFTDAALRLGLSVYLR